MIRRKVQRGIGEITYVRVVLVGRLDSSPADICRRPTCRGHGIIVALACGIAGCDKCSADVDEVATASASCHNIHSRFIYSLIIYLDAIGIVIGHMRVTRRHVFEIDTAVANAQSPKREESGIDVRVAVAGHKVVLGNKIGKKPWSPKSAILER